jgi:hypothetical protein
VEGDSASLGELCALLSAIGDLSIDQSLAVTGSVNQHGQVQPIGGVNEKIEGFFDICNTRGLTGRQGVIMPHANLSDLMLRADVREAVARGEFSVYAAAHADQVMALLTGMSAGVPDADGVYPRGSCNGQIQKRLFNGQPCASATRAARSREIEPRPRTHTPALRRPDHASALFSRISGKQGVDPSGCPPGCRLPRWAATG